MTSAVGVEARAVFISIEGIEAGGKSTLLAAVDHALRAEGHQTLITREPGGTPAGDAIREIFLRPGLRIDPLTEMLLINASRAQLVHEVIRPALERGEVVLCDRYVHSTLAYQGYGRGLPLDLVRSVCDAATGGLMPDLTLLVDVSYETSRRRLSSRGDGLDRVEEEEDAFHRRVRKGFLELGKRDPRVVTVDGELPQDVVIDAAMAALSAVIA
jgi:dTMP kinase